MITADQVQAIKSLPKREQSVKIDAAIDSLMQNGRGKTEAIREVAQALGAKESTVAVGYYRRHRDPNKPTGGVGRPRSNGAGSPSRAQIDADVKQSTKAAHRWAAFEKLINEMVEERVAERLAEARKALA